MGVVISGMTIGFAFSGGTGVLPPFFERVASPGVLTDELDFDDEETAFEFCEIAGTAKIMKTSNGKKCLMTAPNDYKDLDRTNKNEMTLTITPFRS